MQQRLLTNLSPSLELHCLVWIRFGGASTLISPSIIFKCLSNHFSTKVVRYEIAIVPAFKGLMGWPGF
ncbi:hypothetical protein L1987_07383 [Smallanthus sonchifolius]|uniref:Uncharacterized protein n=1 Tax=Smallanthus sonchifolius TaxID=185202 RepID=A0ACB9K0I1_9ASTR|nr:hypothetical protein L1987_07383 [Smallanthus sonchifolius]